MPPVDGLIALPVGQLAKWSIADLVANGCKAIEIAGSFDAIKAVFDQADALRHYLRSIGAASDAVNAAAEIRIRAERRMGEELAKAELAKGAPGNQHTGPVVPADRSKPTLAEIGISKDQSSRFQHLAAIPAEAFEAVIEAHKATDEPISSASVARTAAGLGELPQQAREVLVLRDEAALLNAAKSIRGKKSEARRTERLQTLSDISAGNVELTASRRYPVIYADPPWRYEHVETESRAIENQYPTMTLDDICAMPVSEMATDDAILFMWTTAPKLMEAGLVMESWGFTYRTCAIWDKQKIGMGYYFRIQHEILLIATRGAIPTPAPADRPSSIVSAPRGLHSRKPQEFRAIIEQFYPTLPKIELFCREAPAGWATWGNQVHVAA